MSLSFSSFPSFSCRGRVPFFFLRWFSFHASRNKKKKQKTKKCNKCTCFFLAACFIKQDRRAKCGRTSGENVLLFVRVSYALCCIILKVLRHRLLPASFASGNIGCLRCSAVFVVLFLFCFIYFVLFIFILSLCVPRSAFSSFSFFLFYHPLPSVDFVPFRLFVMSFKCFVFFLLSFFPSFLSSFLVLPYFLLRVSYHYENRVH